MINPMDLSGKRILVTGASSGIGRQTAIYLSKLGATINLLARRESQLNETLQCMEGNNHRLYPFDLTQLDSIQALIKQMIQDGGSLDGVVHCAGIAPMRPLAMTKPEYLHNVMLINFYSFVEIVRCAAAKKYFNMGASFIGISSTAAKKGGKSQIAYAASKAAIDAACLVMAKELAPKGIRINTVMPSLIKTEMYEQFITDAGSSDKQTFVTPEQYLGIGLPQDIASAIAFLLSDSSRFITGTTLVVDGGFLS